MRRKAISEESVFHEPLAEKVHPSSSNRSQKKNMKNIQIKNNSSKQNIGWKLEGGIIIYAYMIYCIQKITRCDY